MTICIYDLFSQVTSHFSIFEIRQVTCCPDAREHTRISRSPLTSLAYSLLYLCAMHQNGTRTLMSDFINPDSRRAAWVSAEILNASRISLDVLEASSIAKSPC
jgi:hypothetical protein